MITVLYDGWSLVYQPNSPSALHLLALLHFCPTGVQPVVALPAEPPEWFPAQVAVQVRPTQPGSRERLLWEQRLLPGLAGEVEARLVHLVSPTPPLFGRLAHVISPAGYADTAEPQRGRGFFDRMRDAAAKGGMSRAGALLWPSDLAGSPPEDIDGPVLPLPVVLHPAFVPRQAYLDNSAPGFDLPETYILYHGPQTEVALHRLLDAWNWAAGPLGDYYPLLLLGLDQPAQERLAHILSASDLGDTVKALPPLSPAELAHVYRGCSALLHPAPVSPWGGPIRPALAAGKPVVALESPLADAMVGPAAYLVPPGDSRAVGAALITTIVEPEVADRLSQAARQRAASWDSAVFPQRLIHAYQSVLGNQESH